MYSAGYQITGCYHSSKTIASNDKVNIEKSWKIEHIFALYERKIQMCLRWKFLLVNLFIHLIKKIFKKYEKLNEGDELELEIKSNLA